MKLRKILFASLLFLLCATIVQAQERPYYDEIQAFKKEDSTRFPAPKQILFIGSSSFNYWKDVQNYFPTHPIINRGFGGSTLLDVISYANDIIFPYKPKQIVIYCGENDLAYSDTVTAQMVLSRFKQLFNMIRKELPGISVAYVSIKPSPSRENLMSKMTEANKLIRSFLKTQKKTAFIDVYHKMLNKKGKPKEEIFGEDQLHMNAKGYAIWQKAIEPYLVK
jgi:lysophospholipase L1-like esterase